MPDRESAAPRAPDERLRRARLTTAGNAVAQGVAVATGLAAVPLTVGYLGPERYGVWVTLSSLLTWLAVTDLGLGGNALVNALAEAYGCDDRAHGRELVATAFWTLAGIGAAVLLVAGAALPWVSWRAVFNVSAAVPEAELATALLLAVALFAVNFPASVTQAVFAGYQEGYLGATFNGLASLASLVALVLVARTEGGLPSLVLALYGARVAVAAGSALVLFGVLRPWLRPTPAAATRRAARRLVGLGAQYLLAQLAGIGLFQSQPLIVTRALGPEAVGVFAVAQRVLTLPLTLVQLLTLPLMPAYGEARARGDWPWIRTTLRRSVRHAVLAGVGLTLLLAAGARSLIEVWVGEALVPAWPLVASLAAYVAAAALVTPLSVLLYGLERVRGQARIALANAAVTVLGAVWLTPGLGLAGTALAMGLGMLAVNGAGQLVELRRAFARRGAAQGAASAGV
jgi:O-antigen/teichoic acid export membrane protein